MPIYYLILLAIIQGITEFLPVSSSAHLILPAKVVEGWPEQTPLIDVMAHFGSLFAVMLYFRRDVGRIIKGFFDLLRRKLGPDSVLALNLIIATPPALIMGGILHTMDYVDLIRTVPVIAATTIIFGLLLWIADIFGKRIKRVDELTWRGALTLGLAQMVALIPGTSRSGITMTAARAMGYTRTESARFSMLMSLPIIGAFGLYALLELATAAPAIGTQTTALSDGLIVAGLSFITAYLAIAAFMSLISRIGMFPFMLYRVALGLGLIAWLMLSGG